MRKGQLKGEEVARKDTDGRWQVRMQCCWQRGYWLPARRTPLQTKSSKGNPTSMLELDEVEGRNCDCRRVGGLGTGNNLLTCAICLLNYNQQTVVS